MNALSLTTLYYLTIGLSSLALLWLLIASVQFIRKRYQQARAAAIIGAVALVFLVIVMWDTHSYRPPSRSAKSAFQF